MVTNYLLVHNIRYPHYPEGRKRALNFCVAALSPLLLLPHSPSLSSFPTPFIHHIVSQSQPTPAFTDRRLKKILRFDL